MVFEVHGDAGLVASCSERETALLLARQWLRERAQRDAGAHTCVVQRRDSAGRVVEDRVIALSDGPLRR
ncbi:MAG: hypothetical protein LC790_05115 [Actinobacteria bacterium]|nr:hypothetical protein [Actinomycetota bacterium]MCA1698306.1 hypothetical protein [Actinomycetota bacterium]